MKLTLLTPEQMEALAPVVRECIDRALPPSEMYKLSLLAGYRLGFKAAREAAAKQADTYMLDHRRHRKGDEWAAATGIAKAIRAIPLPGGE